MTTHDVLSTCGERHFSEVDEFFSEVIPRGHRELNLEPGVPGGG
jgi:hypothetical protein